MAVVDIGIDLKEYYPSVEWDIMSVPAQRNEKFYPCCEEPYPGYFFLNYISIISCLNIGLYECCIIIGRKFRIQWPLYKLYK